MWINSLARRASRSAVVLVLAVFLAGSLATYWSWRSTKQSSETTLNNSISEKIQITEKILDARILSYQHLLEGGSGLFQANSGTITRENWRIYASSQQIMKKFPAIETLGYVENIEGDELANHETKIRSQGFLDYSVNPKTTAKMYSVVVYVEPQTPGSPLGYNMLSDPLRAQALQQANDTGEISSSRVLTLKSNSSKGFLMVYPLYLVPPQEQETKKQTALGFIYTSINIDKLFNYIQKDSTWAGGEFAVSEGDNIYNKNYIYRSGGFNSNGQDIAKSIITVYDKKWVIHSVVDHDSLAYKQAGSRPIISIIVGSLATIIFSFFLMRTLRSRSLRVDSDKQLELQASRDELLSLASHQLRTPATRVKQYLGMVLQGYAGSIDKKQRMLLTRAYTSNEQQLEIVNQILHISRIESGRLELSCQLINMTTLIKRIVGEQRTMIKGKKQKLKISVDKDLPLIEGDEIYLSMVIENLITNASKYTHDKGNISVRAFMGKNSIVAEVSDTGVGIEKKDIQKLFHKFSRVHNELSVSSGGTGLGLYLSRLIVELHGGTMEVVSREKIGTTFRLSLPTKNSKKKEITMRNLTDLKQ